MEKLKLGSLFDGIGGFPFAAMQWEIEPVWASEIEPWPIKVTEHHFPDMKHLGDITQINGAEIEPVDVITFGSPCTRLSVAGKHDGFDITFECEGSKGKKHEKYANRIRATDKYQYIYKDTCPICGEEILRTNESALFFHAIRIIRQMRTATGGKYPRFAVWENVPGAYSSNNGQDFRAVLEEISQAEISMPPSGKWAGAGMVRTSKCDIAWRTLDAQYWGVPQRRRRIFLVADFGGQCAGEVLFKPEGLRGDSTESREQREEVAEATGNGAQTPIAFRMREGCTGGGGKGPLVSYDKTFTLDCGNNQNIAQCVTTGIGRRFDPETETLIAVALSGEKIRTLTARADSSPCVDRGQDVMFIPRVAGFSYKASPSAGSIGFAYEQSPTVLSERQDVAVLFDMTHAEEVIRPVQEGVAPTLNSRMETGGNQVPVMLALTQNQRDEVRDLGDKTGALQAEPGMKQQTFIIQNATRGKSQNGLGISQDDISYTLDSMGNHAVAYPDPANTLLAKTSLSHREDKDNVVTKYAVRRLTPLECLRLQGFPDYWLDIDGMSDTQKYKAIGNSVAIPCVSFILRRISEVLRRV